MRPDSYFFSKHLQLSISGQSENEAKMPFNYPTLNKSFQSHTNAPKFTSQPSPNSPPPAYTPPRLATHFIDMDRPRSELIMNRAPTTQLMGETIAEEIEDGGYSEEGLSSICLRINTSVLVSSHNNLVCLSDPPASHANAIAKAVVQALRENSSGQCGIPMIDEDGRPRPVKIEVDAGVTVEGSGNIIGNESVVRQFLTRGISRKRSADPDDVFTASAPPAQRRRRSLGNDNDDNSNSNNNNGSEGNSGISP